MALFWLKKRGKEQKLIDTMFCLVRPCFFLLSLILNLLPSIFAHRSGLIYHFSVLPCHPCHFSTFFIPSPPFYFATFNNNQKAEIDQQPIVVVNHKHRKELNLTLSLTRLGDYCVPVLLDSSLLQAHTVAQ